MPTQRVILTRTETIEIDINYYVSPPTRAEVEATVNAPLKGNAGDAMPNALTRSMSDWTASRADPKFCVCEETKPKRKPKPRAQPKRILLHRRLRQQ